MSYLDVVYEDPNEPLIFLNLPKKSWACKGFNKLVCYLNELRDLSEFIGFIFFVDHRKYTFCTGEARNWEARKWTFCVVDGPQWIDSHTSTFYIVYMIPPKLCCLGGSNLISSSGWIPLIESLSWTRVWERGHQWKAFFVNVM